MGAPSRSTTGGLRMALDLTELGAQLREQRFRREHPSADETAVRQFMFAWWRERPGAPFGDAEGRPVLPPTKR
jgi:hypothetical protein